MNRCINETAVSLFLSLNLTFAALNNSTTAWACVDEKLMKVETVEQFINWMDDDAANWIEYHFPHARDLLKEVKSFAGFHSTNIFKNTSRLLSNNTSPPSKKRPKKISPYAIAYPFAGSDFAYPFWFGAKRAYLCDSAPLFLNQRQQKIKAIYLLFRKYLPEEEDREQEKMEKFLVLLGLGHKSRWPVADDGPVGYLGLLRLKLLLDANNFQISHSSQSSSGSDIITFRQENQSTNVIHFFSQTNLTEYTSYSKAQSQIYYSYIKSAAPNLVLLRECKASCVKIQKFWKVIGSNTFVYSVGFIPLRPAWIGSQCFPYLSCRCLRMTPINFLTINMSDEDTAHTTQLASESSEHFVSASEYSPHLVANTPGENSEHFTNWASESSEHLKIQTMDQAPPISDSASEEGVPSINPASAPATLPAVPLLRSLAANFPFIEILYVFQSSQFFSPLCF